MAHAIGTWKPLHILEKEIRFQAFSATSAFLPPLLKRRSFRYIVSDAASNSPRRAGDLRCAIFRKQSAAERFGGSYENGRRRKPYESIDDDNDEDGDSEEEADRSHSSYQRRAERDPLLMSEEERREWRSAIRGVLESTPDVEEATDSVVMKKKMENLLANYPLVVDEDDPEWPDDADGWGFDFDQFFNKITIKNVRKDDDDYDSDKELVWQDDNYIRPIKDISSKEWEETVFKDISPLIILVHNRYKSPKQNEMLRDELDKAVNVFWNCALPSPRCIAIDAVVDDDLASALGVSVFPELLFTKAGRILYREKVIRSADELSKIMAFFFYGAARPPCLHNAVGDNQELIPPLSHK